MHLANALKHALVAGLLVLGAASATGQTTLGALLDAGAVALSPDDFRMQLVRRTLRGTSGSGLAFEIVYTAGGVISGQQVREPTGGPGATIDGAWAIDESGRVCSTMRVDSARNSPTYLPPRCQYWFRLGDRYFVADSDSDRQAKVLVRTIVQ